MYFVRFLRREPRRLARVPLVRVVHGGELEPRRVEVRDELERLTLPFTEDNVPSDAELRKACTSVIGALLFPLPSRLRLHTMQSFSAAA